MRDEHFTDGFAMHEVGVNLAREGFEYGDCCVWLVGEAEQKEGDQSDDDLDFHGILGGADEGLDAQILLHPFEEQLDLPAALIEIGDLAGGCLEVVGEDAQHLAGLDPHADFAHRFAERVFTAAGQADRQKSDAVGEDIGFATRNAARVFQSQRRVLFEPRDDATALGIEAGPPSIIVIAKVINVGGAGFYRHGLGNGNIVDPRRGDGEVSRTSGCRVIDQMQLGGLSTAE